MKYNIYSKSSRNKFNSKDWLNTNTKLTAKFNQIWIES